MTSNIENSYYIIVIASILFSFLYSKIYIRLGVIKTLFLAAISSFVSLFLVMVLNTSGLDFDYYDEIVVTGLYIFLFPGKWSWIKDTKGLKK